MKKLYISILMMIFVMLALAGMTYGANKEIIEVPDVKIIMDGQLTHYTDVPLCIRQNTLLPLRELLVNLGVPNDIEHINYNDKEKSVTIIKDQTRIYLAVGNQTATINDQPVKLSVAPVGYEKNQRIYIPFRFIAEALGKKVAWDGSSNAILVCDPAIFESTRQILDNTDAAMKLAGKYRQTFDVNSISQSGQTSMKIGINAEALIDKVQKRMLMKMALNILGIEMKTDTYYIERDSYIQDPLSQTWQKKTYLQPEYDKLFAVQSDTIALKANEPLCAGLTQVSGNNSDEILLKGDVYLGELFKKALTNQPAGNVRITEKELDFDTFYTEISININTFLINSIIMKVGSAQITNKETITTDVNVKVQFNDFNGDFQILVPEDIIKNAVETKLTAK